MYSQEKIGKVCIHAHLANQIVGKLVLPSLMERVSDERS